MITTAGVYNVPEAEYHADPIEGGSLSCSGSKLLLPPSCPAKFKWQRDNGSEHKAVFDFGSAAHRLVLGAGADLEVIDADNWMTKAAKEARAAAYAEGKTPLLRDELVQVQAMAATLREHPIASALFDPERGLPEQSLFWDLDGTAKRARLDWLPDLHNGRMILADYKSTVSSEPGSFAKSVANFGYAMQADFYMNGVRALGLADDVAFLFVTQEKTAPYLISVFELDAEYLRIGAALNRQAEEVYAECTATDSWPSYSDDVVRLSPPSWFSYQHAYLLEMTA